MWTALYMPALPPQTPNPSKFDCESKEAAWDYVYSQMCKSCKESRAKALAGTGDEFDSVDPGCSYEWMVMPTEKYEAAENWDDLNEAAGWKKVWERQ